jgi:hypothetical protein
MGNRKEIEVLWRKILGTTPVHISNHLLKNQVTDKQNQIIDIVYKALVEHIVPNSSPIAYGGKNDDQESQKYRNNLIEHLSELNLDEPTTKELQSAIQRYSKLMEEMISHYVGMYMRLQQLPINNLYFLRQPRITWPAEKWDRMIIEPQGFTFSTSIQGVVPYDLLIAKTKNDYIFCFKYPSHEGLIEALNLNPKLVSYKNADLLSNFVLDITRNRFEGLLEINKNRNENDLDPFSAHLMGDNALTTNLKPLQVYENFDTGKKKTGIIGLIYRLKTETILILYTEDPVSLDSILRVTTAISHLAISCYEYPRTRIIKRKSPISPRFQSDSETINVSGNKSYSKPVYEVWTESELEELGARRGLLKLPEWTESELEELAAQRGIIQLPEWTEDELNELAKNTPVEESKKSRATWTPPAEAHPCPKCDYEMNPDWPSCPICSEPNPFYHNSSESNTLLETENEEEKEWHPPADE